MTNIPKNLREVRNALAIAAVMATPGISKAQDAPAQDKFPQGIEKTSQIASLTDMSTGEDASYCWFMSNKGFQNLADALDKDDVLMTWTDQEGGVKTGVVFDQKTNTAFTFQAIPDNGGLLITTQEKAPEKLTEQVIKTAKKIEKKLKNVEKMASPRGVSRE